MKCNQSIQHIIFETSEKGFNHHLNECESCSTINSNVNSLMSLLDQPVYIPENLVDKISLKKNNFIIGRRKRWDYAGILQLSTVMLAAVLIGVVLGKHANTKILIPKQTQKTELLNEYREMHHLNSDHTTLF